jgi:hypothetical protein
VEQRATAVAPFSTEVTGSLVQQKSENVVIYYTPKLSYSGHTYCKG